MSLMKNQTNPLVIDATGYAPYIKARALRADAAGTHGLKANRNAQTTRDYWQRKKAGEELINYTKNHETDRFRNKWECDGDRKALYSRVQWEMDKITSEMDEDLERRRAKLNDLLETEEQMYMDELESSLQEDPAEKQERMLQRYAQLKMKKEAERQKIVEEKKEQQFIRNCDELRTKVSQKIQRETAVEGKKVIIEKEIEKQQKNKEDSMYAELWERDREAKDLKAEIETEAKKKKGEENAKFIKDQIIMKNLEKLKKIREKENDRAVMDEQKRLAVLEEEYEKDLRKRKMVELKEGLDMCVRAKLKCRTKEVQGELQQDLLFMKQITENEEEAQKCAKKKALMHEQKQYLKYLEDQIKAEADFERQVDKLYQDELENIWKKREAEWEENRQKRRQLEKDVLKEIQEQIISNMDKGRKVQALSQMYGQKVLEEDEEDKKRAKETLQMIRERNVFHQKELIDQIRKKEEDLALEKARTDLELEALRQEREENERKIERLLSDVKIDNEHPFRIKAREIC